MFFLIISNRLLASKTSGTIQHLHHSLSINNKVLNSHSSTFIRHSFQDALKYQFADAQALTYNETVFAQNLCSASISLSNLYITCNAYDSVNSLYVGVHCLDNFNKGNACCSGQMLFLFWERACSCSAGGLELESSCLSLLSDGIGSSQAPSHPAVILKKKMFSLCIWLLMTVAHPYSESQLSMFMNFLLFACHFYGCN